MSVKIGRIQGKASLMTDIGILTYPGALSDGNDITTLCTSLLDTAWKRNLSASVKYSSGVLDNRGGRLCKSIKACESSKAFALREVKNWLNSLVTSFRSLVYTGWEDSLRGMQFRMTFHLELVLLLLSSFLFTNSFSAFLSSDLTLPYFWCYCVLFSANIYSDVSIVLSTSIFCDKYGQSSDSSRTILAFCLLSLLCIVTRK